MNKSCLNGYNNKSQERMAIYNWLINIGFDPCEFTIIMKTGKFTGYDAEVHFLYDLSYRPLFIEVHEDSFKRFYKYGDYGIEGESIPLEEEGRHQATYGGKVEYSKADVFLFYTVNPYDDSYYNLEGYVFNEERDFWKKKIIESENKGKYIINRGYNPDNGRYDSYLSSVYLVSKIVLEKIRINNWKKIIDIIK